MPTAAQERNKSIVQRWVDEVFNGGQLDSVDDLKVSSYLDWTPLPAPYQHTDLPVSGIKDALPEWLSSLPDFHFSSGRLIAERDFVACLGHWRAHHQGTYKGIAATNRRLGGTRIDIFRVAGDKMVEHWGCGNELAFLQLVGVLDASGGGAAANVTDAANAEDIARAFVDRILNKHDLAALVELLDPHAIDHGGQAVAMLGLLTAFPDLRVTVTDVTVDDDQVTITSSFSGTHECAFLGVPATGRQISAQRIDRFRISEGKIVECWCDSDDAEILEQLQG